MGCPKSSLPPEDLVSDENEGQLTGGYNYIWSYTSPEFPLLQHIPCPSVRELAAARVWVAPCEKGLILKYCPDPESSGDGGRSRSKWHNFKARFGGQLVKELD
uniref:Uncharacterized protein n=1 Tax=Arundo donax TaxID=35708 RepID=A0A0A9GIJ0_ARUDO